MPNTEYQVDGLDRQMYGLDAVLIDAYREAKSAVSADPAAAGDFMPAGVMARRALYRRNRVAIEAC